LKKIITILSVFLVILFILIFYLKKDKEYSKNMFYLDTFINVKIYTNKNKSKVDKIFDKIDKIYDKYDKLANAYKQYDNIINVYYLNNVLKENEEVYLDSELASLITYGINVYEKTDGYVNIALGNVTSIWKKYQELKTGLPTYLELNQNININDIIIEDNKFMKKSDIKLDLGAIAKGYITEIVGNFLEKEGFNKYLINAGGNVKLGNHYTDKYVIGLEDPIDQNKIYQKLNLENKSIVTSGDYQRYYKVDGIRYHHIINPKTLYQENYYKSVTVITSDSALADVMSTYLFLLPLENALDVVNKNDDIEAIFYIDNMNIIKSEGIKEYE